MLARRLISWPSTVSFGVAFEYRLAAVFRGGMSGRAARTNGRIWFLITGVAFVASWRTEAFISSRWRANGRRALNAGPSWRANGFTCWKVRVAARSVPGRSAVARWTSGFWAAIAESASLEADTNEVMSPRWLPRSLVRM